MPDDRHISEAILDLIDEALALPEQMRSEMHVLALVVHRRIQRAHMDRTGLTTRERDLELVQDLLISAKAQDAAFILEGQLPEYLAQRKRA